MIHKQDHKITHHSGFYSYKYITFHLQNCIRFQPLTLFLKSMCLSVRILVEFETQSLLCLEYSASTETVMQIHMQDILPFLHTYLTYDYLHHSGKIPFFIVRLQR